MLAACSAQSMRLSVEINLGAARQGRIGNERGHVFDRVVIERQGLELRQVAERGQIDNPVLRGLPFLEIDQRGQKIKILGRGPVPSMLTSAVRLLSGEKSERRNLGTTERDAQVLVARSQRGQRRNLTRFQCGPDERRQSI